ncbi:MAG: hypothetical protein JW929_15105 [Anaerolineales bacterium]|nr:hypothetical protein [Anaerolineales bacterium]
MEGGRAGRRRRSVGGMRDERQRGWFAFCGLFQDDNPLLFAAGGQMWNGEAFSRRTSLSESEARMAHRVEQDHSGTLPEQAAAPKPKGGCSTSDIVPIIF